MSLVWECKRNLTSWKKHMNDSIGLYLNDIGKVPLLTAEDERELSRH